MEPSFTALFVVVVGMLGAVLVTRFAARRRDTSRKLKRLGVAGKASLKPGNTFFVILGLAMLIVGLMMRWLGW